MPFAIANPRELSHKPKFTVLGRAWYNVQEVLVNQVQLHDQASHELIETLTRRASSIVDLATPTAKAFAKESIICCVAESSRVALSTLTSRCPEDALVAPALEHCPRETAQTVVSIGAPLIESTVDKTAAAIKTVLPAVVNACPNAVDHILPA